MKKELTLVIVVAALAVVLTKSCWPSRVSVLKPVPHIVTVHDTVRDTVRLRGPKVVTTDTLQIVVRVTVHDTVQIPVNADSSERPHLWPILSAQIGESRGDTSHVTTFSLRSGITAQSAIWTPGPLRSIWADSTGMPRMDFYEPLKPRGVSLFTKIKWSAVGYGIRFVQDGFQRCR